MMAANWNLSASQSGSIMGSGEDSLQLDDLGEQTDGPEGQQLSDVPPLVIVSSRVKHYASLIRLANPGVAVVYYNYETTSLGRLLVHIGDTMKSRQALSIALVVHGQNGSFKINRQKTVSLAAIKEDRDLQQFFKDLISNYLFTSKEFARLDILNCPVEQTSEGRQLIQALSELINVPVYASEDIWGASFSHEGDSEVVKIGTLYFDGQRLKEWSNQTQQTLDKYEKIRIVGQGAYGQAVLYRRKEDDSLVILKKINILELNKTERQNVVNEIKILAMLDHPHIISYYDNFEEDGVMMIEMEFADGGSLQQFLKQQQSSLSELEVLTKFSQMVDGLNFIHKNNILHRDLKTANIFLTRHGIVKLGDFGIAKVLSATHEAAQTVVGTPYYISPEICEGKQYNAKSDIWSLACILYEMLCLHRTFEGTNLPALVHKIVEGSFEPIKGNYSDKLKQLVKKMLQKDPQARPSASDLHSQLLPPLLTAVQVKEGILQPEINPLPSDDANTKSFLYHLDGQSLLLAPVDWPLEERITHVALGYGHVIVVTCDTTVYSWGENEHGQLGLGDVQSRREPTLIEGLKGRNIQRPECGGEFSIFKSENGIVMSCGRGDKGVLGHGDYKDYLKPEIIQDLLAHDSHVISCGESHVAILTLDWKVFVWGSGEHGRLGTGSDANCCRPTEITLRSRGERMDETAVDVRCGLDATVFITEIGRLFACGNNTENKLGLNQRETFIMHMKKLLNKQQLQVPYALTPTPVKELGKHRIVDCSLGSTHSAFLTETGLVYTFGRNNEGQLGCGNCVPREMPAIVKELRDKPMMVTCSELATMVATENNTFLIWGSRPVIQSPLSCLLSNNNKILQDNSHKTSQESVTDEGPRSLTDVCGSPDSGYRESTPEKGSCNSVNNVPQTGSSHETISTKQSSNEALQAIRHSNDTISKHTPSPKLSQVSNPEHFFSDRPQTFCQYSSDYTRMLYTTLSHNIETGKGQVPISRQSSGPLAQATHRLTKKGGSQGALDAPKDVILKPIVIDLVDKTGTLKSLWQQGLQEIKLEGISCFGCNMIILLHANIPKSKIPDDRRGIFMYGSRLRRSVVSLTSLVKPSTPWKPMDIPVPVEEESESEEETITRVNHNAAIQTEMSDTAELDTWLREDLKDGIPLEQSSSSIEMSHGWFPNLGTEVTQVVKKETWSCESLGKASGSSTDSIPKASSGELSLSDSHVNKRTGNKTSVVVTQHVSGMLSSKKGSLHYHTTSQSAVQLMERYRLIPYTIQEQNELESPSASSMNKKSIAGNNTVATNSVSNATFIKSKPVDPVSKPINPAPKSGSAVSKPGNLVPKSTLSPNTNTQPSTVKKTLSSQTSTTSNPPSRRPKPAQSITTLPTLPQGVLNVKRAQSSGNVTTTSSKIPGGIKEIEAGRGRGKISAPGHLSGFGGQGMKGNGIAQRKPRSFSDPQEKEKVQPPKKQPSEAFLSKQYQTAYSPYAQPLTHAPKTIKVKGTGKLNSNNNGRGAVKTSVQAQINTPDPLQQEKEEQAPDLEQQQLEIETKRKENERLAQENDELKQELKQLKEKMKEEKVVIENQENHQQSTPPMHEEEPVPVDRRVSDVPTRQPRRGSWPWFRRGSQSTNDTEDERTNGTANNRTDSKICLIL